MPLGTYYKEDLTLPKYTEIYVNAVNNSLSGLTSEAVNECSTIATSLITLQTNTTNTINTANTRITNTANLNTLLATQLNNITQSQITNIDTYITNLITDFNITSDTNYTNTFLTSTRTSSGLYTRIGPKINSTIFYYNLLISTSNTGYNAVNTNYNALATTLSSISTNLTSLTTSQTSLNNLKTNVNTQITSCNTSTIKAQTALTNVSNYSNITAIQNALGAIYNNAQASVNKYTVGTEEYKQAYEYLRFLLDPANISNDIENIDRVIDFNKYSSDTNFLKSFLDYFAQNNIKINNIQNVFRSENSNLTNADTGAKISNNNIKNVFDRVIPVIKTNNINVAQNALNRCNSSSTSLNTLLTNINTTLTSINNIISNINLANAIITASNSTILTVAKTVMDDFVNHIFEIVNSPITINSLIAVPNIISRYYNPTNSFYNYGTWYGQIHTIETTGYLTSFYFYSAITTETCIFPFNGLCQSPYINFYITNTFFGTYYSVNLPISSLYKTFGKEFDVISNVNVREGDKVNVAVYQGNICCNVTIKDIQLMLRILIQ